LKQEQTIKKDILQIYIRSQTRKKREEDNVISNTQLFNTILSLNKDCVLLSRILSFLFFIFKKSLITKLKQLENFNEEI